jgi:hypothetical protein
VCQQGRFDTDLGALVPGVHVERGAYCASIRWYGNCRKAGCALAVGPPAPGDSMKSLRLVCTAFLAGVASCSFPAIEGRSSGGAPALRLAESDTSDVAPPAVEVRGFSHSEFVTIVASDADDAEFGLRASVNRDGVLVGGLRFGDHDLYVTPLYARAMGGFKYAADTLGHILLRTGARRDNYACFYGSKCWPSITLGVRMPDSLLRHNRDSLVVRFVPDVGDQWTITMRRELIAAYLKKVDSVVADARKSRAMQAKSIDRL